jgi:hypothetical protein
MVFPQQREAVGDSASAAEIMNLDNNKNAVASAGDHWSSGLNQG